MIVGKGFDDCVHLFIRELNIQFCQVMFLKEFSKLIANTFKITDFKSLSESIPNEDGLLFVVCCWSRRAWRRWARYPWTPLVGRGARQAGRGRRSHRFASWGREDAYLRSGSTPTQNVCFLRVFCWSLILERKTLCTPYYAFGSRVASFVGDSLRPTTCLSFV